jgi:predicted component of type VI protein secretion system
MRFSLVMKLSDGTERKFPLRDSRTVIGRETRCDVRIALPTVANRHCEIHFDSGELKLTDLGSPGGTLLNGNPVTNGAVLGPSDQVTIGPVTFRVESESPSDAAHDLDTAAADTPPVGSDVEIKITPSADLMRDGQRRHRT